MRGQQVCLPGMDCTIMLIRLLPFGETTHDAVQRGTHSSVRVWSAVVDRSVPMMRRRGVRAVLSSDGSQRLSAGCQTYPAAVIRRWMFVWSWPAWRFPPGQHRPRMASIRGSRTGETTTDGTPSLSAPHLRIPLDPQRWSPTNDTATAGLGLRCHCSKRAKSALAKTAQGQRAWHHLALLILRADRELRVCVVLRFHHPAFSCFTLSLRFPCVAFSCI